jgi:hypothetical protein
VAAAVGIGSAEVGAAVVRIFKIVNNNENTVCEKTQMGAATSWLCRNLCFTRFRIAIFTIGIC